MLVLEIELLTGAYRAAHGAGAEWPPHPERVFSALAQAWGDSGCDPHERTALEWLERQGAPTIDADPREFCAERDAPTVFVPPNDDRGGDVAVLPDRRRRQARAFRATIPESPLVRFTWPLAAAPPDALSALKELAQRIASVGHSASLVRCAFTTSATIPAGDRPIWQPSASGSVPLRVPHSGRLDDLVRWYGAEKRERPRSGASARYRPPGRGDVAPAATDAPASVFGGETGWYVFEGVGGFRPDLLGFAHVAKRVRDCLMKLGPQPVPELLSGHTADGRPTAKPHAAVVPLANVGWDHSTGDLLGFAVVLPRTADPGQRRDVLKALAAFVQPDGEGLKAELHFGEAGVWRLEHAATPSRTSLQPWRWCATAHTWASATPVLLDRFPDKGDVVAEAGVIAAACRNIGLPEPETIEIHKHPAVRGAPSAYPTRCNRRRPDWSFPAGSKSANRPRRHVVLRFAAPVTGPVILGAGRFHGFGLCLPIDAEDGQ